MPGWFGWSGWFVVLVGLILVGLAGSVDRFLKQKVVPGDRIFPPPLRKKAPGEKK